MITEERLKEGLTSVKEELGQNLNKLVEAINHEMYEDALLLSAEINLELTATLLAVEFLKEE